MRTTHSTELKPFSIESEGWKERRFEDEKIQDHPELYFSDGNIIVVVQNTAFNLYRGILQRHSGLFVEAEGNAFIISGNMTAEAFTTLCRFLFPKEIGVLPTIQPGDTKKWLPVVQGTINLLMPGVRSYILNKLIEDKTIVTTRAVDFLSWIQDDDNGLEELFFECIQVLAYRCSPLSHSEAMNLSGTRVNQIALARERIRSLFYNPNYWKVRIFNTLCRATSRHCSEGIFLAMTKQMTASTKSTQLGPEPDLLQTVIESMCIVCSNRYAESIKQNANLEIRKCFQDTDETKVLNANPPDNSP